MTSKLDNFTDVLGDPDEICGSQPNLTSQPLSLSSFEELEHPNVINSNITEPNITWKSGTFLNKRPIKGTGQLGEFRSIEEIDEKYRNVFSYPFFNLVQSRVIDDALYSDKSMVVCAPTGSGKTVVFEMAIVRLLMEIEERNENHDFKIIYMAPVKALCTERLTEWYSKFTKLGLLCIEVTGDTDVDFSQLKPYRIIITTPEKWDMLTRRWRDHRQLVEVIKLFLIDEVHILNDDSRGPVLEAVVSRMKTIETSVQSTHRIEQLQQQYQGTAITSNVSPSIRFVAISATVSNPEDVASWLGTTDKPAVYYKFGDECRPVKLRKVVEGYHYTEGTSIFKFDLILNYKLWPIIQKYHNGKPTLIFCNTRKSVAMTAETLSREITISFNEEQKARLTALASMIKNKKLQTLVLSGVGCHHAGLLYEERTNIEQAFRNRDLPILITTTTLAMGVNLPAHLVIIKNTQQYVNGAYQEYSISTVLQMVGRAGRPQFDTEATAVIMTRMADKQRYQALVGGCEPLQSYLHKRLPENLNSEAALGTVSDVAQCVQWLRSTFLCVRAAKDPKRYLGLSQTAPHYQISKKIEELCVKAMNGLASSGLITMDEACCIESTEAGRLMSIFYLDLETMKQIMKIDGSESLERLLWIVCECHELSDMHLRMDERRCLNALNRNNAASTIRFPMKGRITTRQMKLNCVIQAILGCLPIPDPSLNQEAMKVMRIADRVCKCLVAYVTRPALVSEQPKYYSAVLNALIIAKCIVAHLWENSAFVSKQLKGIGPTFSTLLATAGKVNFMLLEESHPRDLERIMNKGPPAGNILRKQISLFPKYQLTMTPLDEKTIIIQLTLLNHHNLSENLENLTAGAGHKSYVVIGDSENNLLLLTSFRDIDLIGVYEGNITYQVTRKHEFEHRIYAHCVSSTFAGIDTQCEYKLEDIEPRQKDSLTGSNNDLVRKPLKKQTVIPDTFKERKRKSVDNDITQSKEKKKRESAFFDKFKNLKESFSKTSKVLKHDINKSVVIPENLLNELKYPDISSDIANSEIARSSVVNDDSTMLGEFNDNNEFINDDVLDEIKINDILNEIECEISKKNRYTKDGFTQSTDMPRPDSKKNVSYRNVYPKINKYKTINHKRKHLIRTMPKKTNYNFIDLLENNVDLSDTEETQEINSFSDAIRSHIEKYLHKTKTTVKPPNTIIDLMQYEPAPSKTNEPLVIVHDSIVTDEDKITSHEKIAPQIGNTTSAVNEEAVVNITENEVSVLQDELKSIDLTSDEMIKTGRQLREKIVEENDDLPLVNLLSIIEKNAEKNEHEIIPKQCSTENKIILENNITVQENSNPTEALIKPESNELSNKTDLQKQMVLEVVAKDFFDQPDKTVIDSHSSLHPIPELNPRSSTSEIVPIGPEEPNTIDDESNKLVAYSHQIPNFKVIQKDFQHLSFGKKHKCAETEPLKIRGFIPPFKTLTTDSIIRQYKNQTSQIVSQVPLTSQIPNLEIDLKKNEIPFYTEITKLNSATHVFNNQSTSSQRKCTNNSFVSSNIVNSVTEFPENPESLITEPKTVIDDKRDMTQNDIITIGNHSARTYLANPSSELYAQQRTDKIEPLKEFNVTDNSTNIAVQNRLDSTQYNDGNASTVNHYVNKYSFSKNEIDISTQKTTGHIVRVIKNLKIDFDITEIISEDSKNDINCNGVKNHTDQEDLSVAFERPKLASQSFAQCARNSDGYRLIELNKTEECRDSLENFNQLIAVENPSESTTQRNNQCELVEVIGKYENSEKCKTGEGELIKEFKFDDSIEKIKPNSVLNILQKYSNIMRNNTRTTGFNFVATKANEKSAFMAKIDKPKRPFKISDINSLNSTPIPDNFIEKRKPLNVNECSNLLEQTDKQSMLEKKNKQLNICELASVPKTYYKEQELSQDRLETFENIKQTLDANCDPSPYEDLQLKTISKIDQTMFNPKALLQCFSTDEHEDIIPPPPEFSDYLNSTTLDIIRNESISMDCYEPIGFEEEMDNESVHRKNVFEESENVELTPSKEIETWNLSRDEESCEMYAPPAFSPCTFTIMRKNKTKQSSVFTGHKFKFNHKNKFKL